MRRNIKNDKVIKAITIGLATMIAATSAPVDALANTDSANPDEAVVTTPAPAEPAAPAQPAQPTANEGDASASPVTDDQASDTVVDGVLDAIGDAAEAVKEHQTETNSQVAGDAAILYELGEAKKELSESENLKDKNLQAGLQKINAEAVATLEENVNALANSLADVPDKEKNKENPSTGYLENSTKDDKKKSRIQYEVPRDENGDLELDDKALPSLGNTEEKLQLSGQYDYTYSDSDLKGRSVQGTYQVGMDQIQKALNERTKGNTDKADEYIAKAGDFLDACEKKSANSKKALGEAWSQYTAADEAAKEAEKCLEGVSEAVLNGAIRDTSAAQATLDAAKKKADQLKGISDQFYGLMLEYYTKAFNNNVAAYDENGRLDINQSDINAVASNKKDVKDRLDSGADLKGSTYEIGRELLELLVTDKLENDGAKDIKFGVSGDDADGNKDGRNKNEKKVKISKDSENKDIIELGNAGSHFQFKEDGSNGRMNHYKVTYKVVENDEEKTVTEYYNIIYKGRNYEGKVVDRTNGAIYVAKVEYDEDNHQWSYAKAEGFLDDFNLTKNYEKAQKDVADAAAALEKLSADLEAMQKVATNKAELAKLKGKLDKAQEAYDNSAKSLKDFQDLYTYLTTGKQPSDRIEREDGPDVLPPTGDVTPDGTTDDGAGTGGGTVIDGGDVSVVIPGGYTLPAGLLDAVAPTGGTASGVLGVRTGGGNAAEALGDGTADDQTGAVSRANFGTVNKVLGSKQKKDNSQLAKKIKDNEIPLAEIPNMDDEVTMNWMWLLIIFLLGATGKKMYDEYKKKKEAEEAAKIDK